MLDRITINPKVCHGMPCIRGLRIPVHLILDLIASGMSTEDILEAYPELEAEDLKQSLEYASWLARLKLLNLKKRWRPYEVFSRHEPISKNGRYVACNGA